MRASQVLLAGFLAPLSLYLQGCGGGGDQPSTTTTTTTEDPNGYTCNSTLRLPEVIAPLEKGLDLDDTTFKSCAGRIPLLWPHTDTKVSSLRLFKPWDASWPEEDREKAWEALETFVRRNDAKVLLGASVSCSEDADDAEWALNLMLMQRLGAKHIMGLAVGNEMELLQWKGKAGNVTKECMHDLWAGGRFWRKTQERVADMDSLGVEFKDVPVTSVFGGFAMSGSPWAEMPTAMINSFMHNATAFFRERWVFTINIYPYYNPSNTLDPNTTDQCEAAINGSICYERGCNVPATAAVVRQRMTLMGAGDYKMWLGETGWSWPMADTLTGANKNMAKCPRFSSEPVFRTFYEGFLKWDMSIKGVKPPEHMFWFTIRDASNFNVREHFGLVEDCAAVSCKMQAPAPNTTDVFVV